MVLRIQVDKYTIALVSDWYYPKAGGVEYSVDSLARNLQAFGHEVHIITKNNGGVPWKDSLPVIRLKGKVIAERLILPAAYKDLYRILKAGSYDIIHAHGLDSPLAMVSLLLARIAGIRCLMTSHSLVGPLRYPILMGARLFLRFADALIAVSSAVEQESKAVFKGRLYRIPNGLDLQSPNGAVQSIPIDTENRIVITTVSRMTRKKGVHDLITIALRLLKRYDNLLFLMIGEGPLRKKLESKVNELNLAQYFLFTGEVSRSTALDLLDKSDIFVLPSPREAFGIVILEAFLKKVPVVARNHSGVSDLITHGETGLLADDDEQMARYIEELIGRPELAASLSAAACQELHRYRWQDIAKRVEEVYKAILDEEACDLR
jgi:glycosyltransferase involved in cell wall biosynthesis